MNLRITSRWLVRSRR